MKNGNTIDLALGLALAAFFALSVLSFRATARFIETSNWVSHTVAVLGQLSETSNLVSVAVSSRRGYALTGLDSEARLMQAALDGLPSEIQKLRDMTADNPEQGPHVEDLRRAVDRMNAVYQESAEERARRGLVLPSQKKLTVEGTAAMNAAQAEIAKMADEERRLLEIRSSAEKRSAQGCRLALAFGGLFGLALILTAFIRLKQEIAESKLLQGERDRFFSLSGDMICIAGFDGYFKQVNPAWEEVLGFSREELLAKPYMDFIHPDDRAKTGAEAGKNAAGIVTMSFENRYLCKDGSYKWLHWSAVPVEEERRIYAAARDRTESKQAEDQIRKLNETLWDHSARLEAANKELEAFSYSVSHDLRAPLRAVNGFAGVLIEDFAAGLDPEARRYLDLIQSNAKSMGQLIDDLLTFSRLGRQSLRLAEVDMTALARGVFDELRAAAPERRIDLDLKTLPKATGDPALFRQVFVNLLSNAIKYTRPRAPAVIEVGARPEGKECVYYVKDNGVGFDMRYADKLFGVFQRLHTASEFEGTGVGLAIVQRVVHRHGGRVWAESKPDQGASFFVALQKEAIA